MRIVLLGGVAIAVILSLAVNLRAVPCERCQIACADPPDLGADMVPPGYTDVAILIDRSYSVLWATEQCLDCDSSLPPQQELHARQQWAAELDGLLARLKKIIDRPRFTVVYAPAPVEHRKRKKRATEIWRVEWPSEGGPFQVDPSARNIDLHRDGRSPLYEAVASLLDQPKDHCPSLVLLLTDGDENDQPDAMREAFQDFQARRPECIRRALLPQLPSLVVKPEKSGKKKFRPSPVGSELKRLGIRSLGIVLATPFQHGPGFDDLDEFANSFRSDGGAGEGEVSLATLAGCENDGGVCEAAEAIARQWHALKLDSRRAGQVIRNDGGSSSSVPSCRSDEDDDFDDVALVGSRSGWHCSGILVSPFAVLTAGHCLPASRVSFSGASGESGEVRAVIGDARPLKPNVDLALLRLDHAVSGAVEHSRRVDVSREFNGVVRSVGFGAVDSRGVAGFGRRHFVEQPASGWGCPPDRAARLGCDPTHELVLPPSGGRDTCDGDSGGPLFELVDTAPPCCRWRLLGITSRPVANSKIRCGGGGIYERVDVAAPWIERTLSAWK